MRLERACRQQLSHVLQAAHVREGSAATAGGDGEALVLHGERYAVGGLVNLAGLFVDLVARVRGPRDHRLKRGHHLPSIKRPVIGSHSAYVGVAARGWRRSAARVHRVRLPRQAEQPLRLVLDFHGTHRVHRSGASP